MVNKIKFFSNQNVQCVSFFVDNNPITVPVKMETYENPNSIVSTSRFAISGENSNQNIISQICFLNEEIGFKIINEYSTTNLSKISPLNRSLVKDFFAQYLHGLKYLHDKNYLHLNLTPKNLKIVIIPYYKPICKINITSKAVVGNVAYSKTKKNNEYFIPPEIIFYDDIYKYTKGYDIWCLGASIFYMITGKIYNFNSQKYEDNLLYIASMLNESNKEFEFEDKKEIWYYVEILAHMLNFLPENRPTVNEILSHPFFKFCDICSDTKIKNSQIRYYDNNLKYRLQYKPIAKLTKFKIELVRNKLKDINHKINYKHLPIEVIFVVFDNIMRTIATIESEKINNIVEAASNVSLLLYDDVDSLNIKVGYYEIKVINYLSNDLIRKYYLYDHLISKNEIIDIIYLMMNNDDFVHSYLELDVEEFIGNMFGFAGRIPLNSVMPEIPIIVKNGKEEFYFLDDLIM